MDTTETYIKMADCEEIQEAQGGYDEHDYIHLGENYGLDNIKDTVWLPRQDQLQEMVLTRFLEFREMHLRFSQWLDVLHLQEYFSLLNSMEQLWLAFVMKELHNKTWTGEKWNGK